MADQQPSVGRIVHYVSHGSPVLPDGTQTYAPQCRAAMVTEFAGRSSGEGGELVGLCVFNPEGMYFLRDAVHSEPDDAHLGGTWHWPERV